MKIPSADYADNTDRRKRESAQSATSADGMRMGLYGKGLRLWETKKSIVDY
jgi:hypothetical protein